MSKFVKLPTKSGKDVIVNLDKVMFVEESSEYITLIFGRGGDMRLVCNIAMSMDAFLSLTSDKA